MGSQERSDSAPTRGRRRGDWVPSRLLGKQLRAKEEHASLLPACRPGVYTQEDKVAQQLRGLVQARVCSSGKVESGGIGLAAARDASSFAVTNASRRCCSSPSRRSRNEGFKRESAPWCRSPGQGAREAGQSGTIRRPPPNFLKILIFHYAFLFFGRIA